MKVKACVLLAGLALLYPLTGHAATSGDSGGSDVYVQVRTTKLKAKPQQWSTAAADLKYGDRLTQTGAEGSWLKVKTAGGASGYVHVSAVSARKIVLSSKSTGDNGTNSEDVVLAGKGFSKEIESQYAAQNGALDFKEVDRMESIKVSPKELAAFMQAGKLG